MNSREAPTTSDDETGVASPRVEQIGVQSVEVAGRLLKALATLDGPQTLTALSAAAGLPPRTSRRPPTKGKPLSASSGTSGAKSILPWNHGFTV